MTSNEQLARLLENYNLTDSSQCLLSYSTHPDSISKDDIDKVFESITTLLETFERRDTAYRTIIDLLKEGFELRLKHDEITDSLFLQIRNGNYVEERHIGLFTYSPDYDIAFNLSAMKEDIKKELNKGEKENG